MIEFEGRPVVLSALVGSWAYNLNTPESDRDFKHFVVPTFADLYHGKMFATAHTSDTLDYDVHDIRKLGELLWKSNLNYLVVLFSREKIYHPMLQWLFDNADDIAKMNLPYLYNAAMGMHHEKMKALLKGTGTTQALVDKFGYDTKQACHAFRCLVVLLNISYGQSIREAIWMESVVRDMLLDIKAGEWSLESFLELVRVWKEFNLPNVKAFFKDTKPNEDTRKMVEENIEKLIKTGLFAELSRN